MQESKTVQTGIDSSNAVKGFFAAFGRGDVAGIAALFHPSAQVVAVRSGERRPGQVHGSYTGQAGVTEFINNVVSSFEPQAFDVQHVISEGEVAFASGSFTHRVKSNGKLWSSEWALKCRVSERQIVDFHFYEDSAALVAVDPMCAAA